MDAMTIAKRLQGFARWSHPVGLPTPDKTNVADRLKDLTKRVNASKPVKNRWGGKDYPIDVADYGQFIGALQTLQWLFRDMGYEIHWLTGAGLTYGGSDYYSNSQLFDRQGAKVVALVAVGKDGSCFRVTRDGTHLRYRAFKDSARALTPLRSGEDPGSRALSAGLAKEIVKIVSAGSKVDPSDPKSLQRWGRLINTLKPVFASPLKARVKMEFRKYRA
jgi:hypothetical protein